MILKALFSIKIIEIFDLHNQTLKNRPEKVRMKATIYSSGKSTECSIHCKKISYQVYISPFMELFEIWKRGKHLQRLVQQHSMQDSKHCNKDIL